MPVCFGLTVGLDIIVTRAASAVWPSILISLSCILADWYGNYHQAAVALRNAGKSVQ